MRFSDIEGSTALLHRLGNDLADLERVRGAAASLSDVFVHGVFFIPLAAVRDAEAM